MEATLPLSERTRTTAGIVLLPTVASERVGWTMLRKEQ